MFVQSSPLNAQVISVVLVNVVVILVSFLPCAVKMLFPKLVQFTVKFSVCDALTAVELRFQLMMSIAESYAPDWNINGTSQVLGVLIVTFQP